MIDKPTYKFLSSKWEGKIYQKWKKLKKRLPMLSDNIEFFKDAHVLELGSNAGIYAWCIYNYVSSYIGIESDQHYFRQSQHTLRGKDVTLINDKFETVDLSSLDFNLFLASYVLHHLNRIEIEKLNTVFERCNKVAIHTRSGDPLRYGHDEIGFDPIPKWNSSKLKEMLGKHGYTSRIITGRKVDYNGVYMILAEKHGNDKG